MLRFIMASLEYFDEEWIWHGSYEENHYPKSAGFYWSPKQRCLVTPLVRRAARLIQFADEPTRRIIRDRLVFVPHGLELEPPGRKNRHFK